MKLKVADRLTLLNILPKEGDILTIRIIRDAQQVLGLNEKEIEKLQLKQEEGGTVRWSAEADVPTDIEIGPRVARIICDKLEELSKEGKLTLPMLPLYELFVEPPEPDEKVRPIKK